MRLWRLVKKAYLDLDGSGPAQHGARWVSPGRPMVNFASEAGLAVLVVLRYLPKDLAGIDNDYYLGWTECDIRPFDIPFTTDPEEKRRRGDNWLAAGTHLLARVQSAVLPEGDIIMMNPLHPEAAKILPLTTRPFSFADTMRLPQA